MSFSEHPEINDWSEEETVDRLLELLKRGVEKRLMSDVPVGFFLSGGIDSSLSTVIAAEMSSAPLKTFTLTYAKGSTNSGKEEDRRWARWVAKRYGTQRNKLIFDCKYFVNIFPLAMEIPARAARYRVQLTSLRAIHQS